MSTTADISHELADFLRTRRKRLAPDDVELRTGGRTRRTPGLRREEVAELAGVSVDYVIRLEQARGLRPSPGVLEALANALRLTDDERAYLFDLARQRPTGRRRAARPDPGPLGQLVHDLEPLPAMLLNHRLDIITWNDAMSRLVMVDLDSLPAEHRNVMWLCVLQLPHRDFYLEREQVIRQGIADLRAAWASRTDDPEMATLIDELTSQSAEFARLWDEHDVRVNGRGRKRLRHPEAGRIDIDFDALTPLDDRDQRLVVYRAADDASQTALDTIRGSTAQTP
ncbi:helix-turn-helix transcriptional regulator [Phytoactinopolyspora halophila]|nr:helix-turn-helix transcriptional regulator [Phytoactinopolyspora halophila]